MINEKEEKQNCRPMFHPGALQDPVWYEGQTVFEMGNGKIAWKNRIYDCCCGFVESAKTVDENKEKSIVKVNLARDAFIHKAKIALATILIYTPILLGILLLFR